MPRIPRRRSHQAGPLIRLIYAFCRREYGAVLDPVAVLAWHPRLVLAGSAGEFAVERALRVLPVELREIAQYRVATEIGCSWCVDFGQMLQRHRGLDVERLAEIDDYRTSSAFTADERLVIAYADAMTAVPMQVTDEQVAELDRRFGHAGVVELTYAIAVENERTRINHALGITEQGFTSGAACRVPEPGAATAGSGS